ncbi:MAG: ABC transporter permease [Acidimicrobiales bacterium]
MIRAAVLLNLRHLRRQRLRTALAVLAIAAGVSLVMAVLVVSQSISASAAAYSRTLAGPTPLRVEGADSQGGVTNATVAKIRATPGVAAAVPVVVAVTTVDTTSHGPLLVAAIGVDCSVEVLVGNFGCSSSAVGAASTESPPLVSPSLLAQVGPRAVVHTDLNLIPLADAPTLPQLNGFNQGRVLVFPLPEAQQIFDRPGQVDDVYVKPGRGVAVSELAARLRAAIGPQNPVISANSPPSAEALASGFLPLLSTLGLAALAMGGILVANILNLSLAERRRELAVAAALGAERRSVIAGILLEAAVLGLAGGALGALFGAVLAHPLVASVSETAVHFAGVAISPTLRPATVVLTMAVAVAIACLGALGPARRATAVDLAAELSERREPTRERRSLGLRALVLTGVGLFGLGLTWVGQLHGSLSVWQPVVGEAGLLVAAVALIAAAGSWTPLVLRSLGALLDRRSGVVAVGLTGLANESGRVAGMAVAVATAVALGAGLGGMVPSLHAALVDSFGHISGERVYVSTVPITNGAWTDSKLNPAELATLGRIPGVARVGSDYYVNTNGSAGYLALSAVSIPPGSQPFSRYAGGVPSRVLASGQAMVGASLARTQHLVTGSVLSLPSPSGMVPLRVGGIWADANDNGLDVMVSQATMLAHWGPLPPGEVFLTPRPGVSPQTLAARVRAAHLGPDVNVQAPAGYLNQFTADVNQQIQPFWVIQRALLALALLATLSTLLLVGVQRRRELGLLGALGLGPGGLARMTLVEAGGIGLVASVLGVGAGVGILVAFRDSAGYLFGLEPPLLLGGLVLPAIVYCLIAVAAVLIGAGLPAWRTSQLQITEALRYE